MQERHDLCYYKIFVKGEGKNKPIQDKDGLDYQIKVLLNTFDDELEKTFLKREFEKIGSVPEKEMFLDSLLAKSCE